MSAHAPSAKTIRILACGGFGSNIGAAYIDRPSLESTGRKAIVDFFDTSRSNLPSLNLEAERIHLAPSADGAGKDRTKAADILRPLVADAIKGLGAGDYFIVVFSAAGGTGSVWGPLLVEQLLRLKKVVIAVVQPDNISHVTCENSYKTVEGLRRLPRTYGQSLPIYLQPFRQGDSRKAADADFLSFLDELTFLIETTAIPNSELDSQDINNFLRTEVSCKVEPAMTLLDVYAEDDKFEDPAGLLSMVSLYGSPDEVVSSSTAIYRAVGYNPILKTTGRDQKGVSKPSTLHFTTNAKLAASAVNQLAELWKESERRIAEQRMIPSFDDDGHEGDDGLLM